MIHHLGRTAHDFIKLLRMAQFKTHELFISGIFHLIFLATVDRGSPRIRGLLYSDD
jgi:hypothetical protein